MTAASDLPPPPPLADLAEAGPVALFLDFDGTLVAIADGPDAIVVPDGLARALEASSERLAGRLALISGRALDDLAKHLGPLALAQAGSHGAHRVTAAGEVLGDRPRPLDPAVVAALAEFAAVTDGVVKETKEHGGALHYRGNPASEPQVIAFMEETARANDLAVKRGKCVVELVRPGADKGGAVAAFLAIAPFQGALPVFIGDDVTDEDGFKAATKAGGFGICVGDRGETAARYALPDPAAVHDWLQLELNG